MADNTAPPVNNTPPNPMPAPPVVAADAPGAGISAKDVLGGVVSPEQPRIQRPAGQTFKEALVSDLTGPQYTTDASGNVVPKVQTDKYGNPIHATMSMRGILAGILAGAAKGALGGLSAERKPGENPYVAGAAGARQLQLDQEDRARKIAQQNYENQQKKQQMDIEKSKLMDAETTQKLANAKMSMENYSLAFQNRTMAEQYKYLTEKQQLDLDSLYQKNVQATDDFIGQFIEATGDPDAVEIPGVGHGVLTQEHAHDIATGNTIMYDTNKHGGTEDQFGYGLLDYSAARNMPLRKDVSIYETTIDPKTGEVGKKLITTIKAGQPAYMAVDAYNAGMTRFNTAYKIYAEGLNVQAQHARIADEQANAARTNQDVDEINKEIKDITTPDPTGFKPTLSQKEYDKRADSFTKSKDYTTVMGLKGSYQQFQDILNKVNAGQMTGADSVVALFDAVGISATPLAGKGMRINQEVFNEHIGARGAAQALEAKFQKINTGGPITPQQIRDYANIAQNVYENSFVNLAEEAHGQGLKINFLPQGGGQKSTPLINDIFMRVALAQHPELAKDKNQAIQAARSMLTATGWN